MKKRYDSYKPSGIDWIGDIPTYWKVVPIKQICRSEKYAIKTGPFGSQLKGEDLKETGDIRVYNQRNVIDNDFSEVTSFVTSEKAKDLESFYTLPNDLLITSRGTIGKAAILPSSVEMGILHPCLIALRIDIHKANLKWVQRWINESEAFRIEIASKSNATTIDVIYTETIKNIRLVLPPLAEQEAIAAWLDEKCEDIDAAIAKVDREIELIDELKQSEISRVVTRGLNPDAPLRPSGIDWIGDIPKHWIICKVKHLVKFNSGDTITSEQFIDNAEFPVYGANGYRGQFDKYNFENQRILIGRVGALCGNVHYTNEKIWCSEHALISSKAFGGLSFDYKWMCLLFESMNLNQYGGGSAQPVIASSVIENLSIILPPLSEQQAIADYLDKKCTEIDGLKAKLIKKRETLKELRQSIISEVVTGKRKVI